MTTEEKAKAYDEALDKARELYEKDSVFDSEKTLIRCIFPELAESEDERIRKCLIDFFEDWHENRSHCWGIAVTAILAWLEKQGKSSVKWKKNTPDNKPPINHSVLIKATHGVAEGYFVGSLWFQFRWSSNIYDSDVLAWMELSDLDEQNEQKPTSDTRYEGKAGDSLSANGKPFDYEKATITQKDFAPQQEWSKEDENRFQNIIACIEDCYNEKDAQDLIRWFKSLRHQPKQVWSEEDEEMTEDLIKGCVSAQIKAHHFLHTPKEVSDWLKSIKDRMQGKED